jgi:hypothetical protein
LEAVSSRTADFLACWPRDGFLFLFCSSLELELSSDSEEEATLSPELLLERYLLLLVLERLVFVLLKSEAAGFWLFLVVPMRPRAL